MFGTPLRFGARQWMLKLWGVMAQVHRVLPTMDQEAWGRRMLPLMNKNRKALDFFLRYLANPDNVDTETSLDLFDKLVTNEAPGIVLQFSEWVRTGEITSADRSYSYTENLGRVDVPTLFVCGASDLMAPAEVIAREMKHLGSQHKEQWVLSKRNGFSADYGHGDLLMGRNAPDEVYPRVCAWMDSLAPGVPLRQGGS
jgi:pimeloyl-ACP methyl ester carboxylesterase